MVSARPPSAAQSRRVENVLIASKQFHLPGRKALQPSDTIIEIVLVDATEQPIERPKKDKNGITAAKRERHTQKAQLMTNLHTARNPDHRLL